MVLHVVEEIAPECVFIEPQVGGGVKDELIAGGKPSFKSGFQQVSHAGGVESGSSHPTGEDEGELGELFPFLSEIQQSPSFFDTGAGRQGCVADNLDGVGAEGEGVGTRGRFLGQGPGAPEGELVGMMGSGEEDWLVGKISGQNQQCELTVIR